jgi:hypothetical protein
MFLPGLSAGLPGLPGFAIRDEAFRWHEFGILPIET